MSRDLSRRSFLMTAGTIAVAAALSLQRASAQVPAFEASRIRLEVVKRTDKEIKGFIVLPKRWIVERTFGWINRARRLSKDFEALLESSQAWVLLAIAFLLVRRIARDYTAAA